MAMRSRANAGPRGLGVDDGTFHIDGIQRIGAQGIAGLSSRQCLLYIKFSQRILTV